MPNIWPTQTPKEFISDSLRPERLAPFLIPRNSAARSWNGELSRSGFLTAPGSSPMLIRPGRVPRSRAPRDQASGLSPFLAGRRTDSATRPPHNPFLRMAPQFLLEQTKAGLGIVKYG